MSSKRVWVLIAVLSVLSLLAAACGAGTPAPATQVPKATEAAKATQAPAATAAPKDSPQRKIGSPQRSRARFTVPCPSETNGPSPNSPGRPPKAGYSANTTRSPSGSRAAM